MNDLHDDVKSAFDTVAADDTNPGSQVGSPPSETLPPVEATPPINERARDGEGKFVSLKDPHAPEAPQAPKAPVPPPPQAPPLGGEPAVKLDPSKPPSAWTPASKAQWNTIPQPIREEIIRREEATAAGIQKLQQQYEIPSILYNELAQYGGYVEHIEADPLQYVHRVINTEQTLRLGNPAQRLELLLDIGDFYGIPLRNTVDQAMNGQLNAVLQQAHQHHQTPQQLPPEVAQELQEMRQWRGNLESYAAQSELEEFAETHPLLGHVSERMAQLIESGATTEYQEAYDIAVLQNPQLRQWALQQAQGQRNAGGIQARQAAAASVVAPGSAPLEGGGDGVGDTDDVHEAVRRAWNANAGRA